MASAFFNTAFREFMLANIELIDDTINYAFMKSSWTPNIDTEDYYDDVSAHVAGGSSVAALGGKTLTVDTTNDLVYFDATDLSLSNQTFSDASNKILIYRSTGVASTSQLICYIEITSIQPVAGTVAVTWAAGGLFSLGN